MISFGSNVVNAVNLLLSKWSTSYRSQCLPIFNELLRVEVLWFEVFAHFQECESPWHRDHFSSETFDFFTVRYYAYVLCPFRKVRVAMSP